MITTTTAIMIIIMLMIQNLSSCAVPDDLKQKSKENEKNA